jgi:transglutaminase-like putative cysteine protease
MRPADAPTELPADQMRHYTIWLGGARVGTAVEAERWTTRGLTLWRRETLRFLRSESEVRLTTEIVIDADLALQPRHVRWRETGTSARAAEASRGSDGWQVSTGERLPADAVPAELVPLVVRRDGQFSGRVFLPARGFVAGSGRIEPIAAARTVRRFVARLALDAGPLVEATIDVGSDGAPARVVDGEGVIAIRATEAQAIADFPSVDLIAATAIPIEGRQRAQLLVLDGDLALPALPGQRARPTASGVEVELSSRFAGELPAETPGRDRSSEIRTLVTSVRQRITPDLAAGPVSARAAANATAGDCTTFALAYAALAGERGIPTRVVTGLRVDDARLVRHRWAVSWTGTRWIAIDAAFGQAPAGGDLIGLAVHGADDAGLVAGEAALTSVRGAAWSAPPM